MLSPPIPVTVVPAGTPGPVTVWPITRFAAFATVTVFVPLAVELTSSGANVNGTVPPAAAVGGVMVVGRDMAVMAVPAGMTALATTAWPTTNPAVLKIPVTALLPAVVVAPSTIA